MKKFIFIIVGIFVVFGSCFLLFKKNTSAHFNTNIEIQDEKLGIQITANNKSLREVTEMLEEKLNSLHLDFVQNGNVVDSIPFSDLHIQTNMEESLLKAKAINDNFWGFDKYTQQIIPISLILEIDDAILAKQISKLNCLTDYIESEDAHLEKIDNEMKVIPEIYGTKIDEVLLNEIVKKHIQENSLTIDLDSENIYEEPSVFQDDVTLNARADLFNKIVNLKVEYVFGDKIEKISKGQLSDWISLNEDELVFDEEKILAYIENLAHTYNTFGTKRNFKTTNGETIVVPAGDYGWSISQTKEMARLIEELKEGNDIHREPTWLYQGYGNYVNNNGCDIGNSYVEISIPAQTLWLYVDGDLILTSQFVSGTESNGCSTPSGVFGITYKTRNATLRGRGYATPVKYWMPFNGNIGMHDATWRSSFGGNIYKTSGSHGCINLPLENAKAIYEYMDTFFPIVVYRQTELDNAK